MNTHRIAVIPGDGIGKEVVPEGLRALDAAARRFLHLVDELYDRRVKLILSAAVPLEELYSGELHEFAHERLTSRLVEMQSTGYLAAGGEGRAP